MDFVLANGQFLEVNSGQYLSQWRRAEVPIDITAFRFLLMFGRNQQILSCSFWKQNEYSFPTLFLYILEMTDLETKFRSQRVGFHSSLVVQAICDPNL